MKVAKNKLPSMMIYFVVFLIISVIMSSDSANKTDFEDSKLDICIVDLDKTPASRALSEFISKKHNIVKVKNDDDAVQDALFYREIDGYITVKEGFSERLGNGQTDKLFTLKTNPGTYQSSFFESQLDQYISSVNIFITGGADAKTACEKATKAAEKSVDVKVESFGEEKGGNFFIANYCQYLAYVFPSMLIAGLSPVLIKLNKKDLKNRMNCSSLKNTSITAQKILGAFVIVAAVWLAFFILESVKCTSQLYTKNGALSLLNSLVMILISAGVTLLVSQFDLGEQTINMISNVLSLGMSFLCGVFVPQEILGSGVLAAAKFLPVFWYVKANNTIWSVGGEVFSTSGALKCIGIEALFALALFTAVMVISKKKVRS